MGRFSLIPALAAVMAVLCLGSCSSSREKTVEFPLVDFSNTTIVGISKVELTDSSTVLSVEAQYIPRYWIEISSDSYLVADGEKYALTGADGIPLDEHFWMPESGEASFKLVFEPLPLRTKSFDFIESDCETCFRLYGIDLTGKTEYSPAKGIPAAVRKTPDFDRPLPDPDFSARETVVRVHFLNYRPEMGNKIDIYVNSMLLGQTAYSAAIDQDTAIAEFRFLQCGPADALIVYNYCGGDFRIAPGDDMDVWFDMRITGWLSRLQAMEQVTGVYPELAGNRFIYASGKYGDLTALCAAYGGGSQYSMNLYSGEFADYKMTADEYTDHVISKYKAAVDSIAAASSPLMLKELQTVNLKEDAFIAMAKADDLRLHNYMNVTGKWDLWNKKFDWMESLRPEHYARFCSLFDINDPKLLMGTKSSEFAEAAADPDIDWPAAAGLESGLVPDLRKVYGLSKKAQDGVLTDEDFAVLESMDNEFYLDSYRKMQAETEKALAELSAMERMKEVPDVDDSELFDAIIAPYKGKVVLVDFWNTWCAPCRASIAAVEPLKSAEFADEDMVWIYIANESSPLVKYKEMISEIEGVHYRLDQKRWDYLSDKFGIDGIPSYVLVDRSGQYGLRNDFRDHNNMKRTLSGMLED